jgi:hypothetical protein
MDVCVVIANAVEWPNQYQNERTETMDRKKKVVVQQDPEKPVDKGVLAAHIIEISRGVSKLLNTGINRRAIVALLYDSTKLPKSTISAVLDGITDLERDYCR